MKYIVHVINDPQAIELLVNDDYDGLKEYLDCGYLYNVEEEEFATEREALAFCKGLGEGEDERAMPALYPLRSFEPADQPYIALLEEYR